MSEVIRLKVQPLTREAYAPYGWVLGGVPDTQSDEYYDGESVTYWHEHDFVVGDGGDVQLVWVHYKRRDFEITSLESHRLTEQVIVSVAGQPIVHVVCPPPDDPMAMDNSPDLSRMSAFLLDSKTGICMRRGTWHTHFPLAEETTHFMITRHSSTLDILAAHQPGRDLTETVKRELSTLTSATYELTL